MRRIKKHDSTSGHKGAKKHRAQRVTKRKREACARERGKTHACVLKTRMTRKGKGEVAGMSSTQRDEVATLA